MFDTVFSQVGTDSPMSITQQLWVINHNSKGVRTNIHVKGSANGFLRLNIDGKPGNTISGKEIRGNDSIVIFVQFYSNAGFDGFIADQIIFETNGNSQDVDIVGVGENAIFYNQKILDCTTDMNWKPGKPYLIYGSVLVPFGCTLNIDAGTKIYSYNNSAILVQGTLKVNGSYANPVIFDGSRLDPYHLDPYHIHDANQWHGIVLLRGSTGNVIDGAIIKNGIVGVEVDSVPVDGNPNLIISNSIIKDMGAIGLLGKSCYVVAYNNVIVNCLQYTFLGYLGGTYHLYYNTFALYSDGTRSGPQFILDNSPVNGLKFPLKFEVRNNIIWGGQEDELLVNNNPDGIQDSSSWDISYNLFRTKDLDYETTHNILNQDPHFEDQSKYKFNVTDFTPARLHGIPVIVPPIPTDITGASRSTTAPTIGAYE